VRETRKIWLRNVAVVEESLWGRCFVFGWHKAFKGGRESVEGEEHAGRPSAARNGNIVASVNSVQDRGRRLNVRLIAEEVGLPKTDVHRIRGETADKWFTSPRQCAKSHSIRCKGIFDSK